MDAIACTLRRFVLALALACGSATSAAHAAELAFELAIERGRVAQSLRLIRVKQGDLVKLRWSSDRPMILHLHGYDLEAKVEPGAVAAMTFSARATGRFPIHGHDPGDRPGSDAHHAAPLVQIEVHPR